MEYDDDKVNITNIIDMINFLNININTRNEYNIIENVHGKYLL